MNVESICFLYETRFRCDGSPLFMSVAAKRHNAELELKKATNKIPIGDLRRYGNFDLWFWLDHGEDALGTEKCVCLKPNAYWAGDTHLGWDYRLEKAREFDYIFACQKDAVEKYKAEGFKEVYWIPHAGDPYAYDYGAITEVKGPPFILYNPDKRIVQAKKYDVCFVGFSNSEERCRKLDVLFKAVPNFFYAAGRFFTKVSKIYAQSKLVFNESIRNDINMRCFEAMCSGSALLTNYHDNGFEDLGFKDGENVIFYHDDKELVDKAQYYIGHDEEREKIAKAGQELALNNHTYFHRLKKVLEILRAK